MDISKEREVFEFWYLNYYYTRNGLKPDGDIFKKYSDGNDWTYLYDSVFRAWTVWLAAKQQAVPDGCVVVPVEPTDEIVNAEHRSVNKFSSITLAYKAMIQEAQR